MRSPRSAALFLLLLPAFYACSERSSVSGVMHSAALSIVPRYNVLGAHSSDPIAQIILTARRVDNGNVVAADTFAVSDQARWEVSFQVPGDAGTIAITVELLDATGEVEWSGVTPPITVQAGRTNEPAPVVLQQGPTANLTVSSVTINPEAVTVIEGASVALSANIVGGGPGARAIWSTLDAAVATVDQNGNVSTLRDGAARIVAVAGPRADTAVITITQRAASIALAPDTQRIHALGAEVTFTARVLDPRGAEISGAGVVWSSANPSVAQHSGNGRFRAMSNGTTQITALSATNSAISRSGTLIVSQRVARVVVAPPNATLTAVGATQTFAATAEDAGGARMNVAFTWRSATPTVAAIDAATGVATALAMGTTQVSAVAGAGTPDSVVGQASLQVMQTIRSITITPPNATLESFGDTVTLTATARDANNNAIPGVRFDWSPAIANVVRVSSDGVVTALGNGITPVVASAGRISGDAGITVAQRVRSVSVTPATATLNSFGQTVQLTAVPRDGNGNPIANRTVTWSSGNTDVASVDGVGSVKAVGNGVTDIRAAVDDTAGHATITVQQTQASIAIAPQSDTVIVNDTTRFVAVARDANGAAITGATFTWTVGDTSVASVDTNGLARGKRSGTTTVTASRQGISAHATLFVIADPNLVVTRITVTPAQMIAEGDSAFVTVVIKNTGGVAAPASQTGLAVFDAGSLGRIADTDTLFATPPLNPGDSAVLGFAGSADDLQGWPDSVKIGAKADAIAAISESNESDNELYSSTRYIQFAVHSISLSVGFPEFSAIGDTIRMSATAHDVNTRQMNVPVTMIVRDTTIAQIDSAGNLVSKRQGVTTLVASAGGVTDSTGVRVEQVAVRVDLTPDSTLFNAVADSARFTARAYDARNHVINRFIPLMSRNDTVAFVADTFGHVVSERVGKTHIIAKTWGCCGDLLDSAVVVVRQVLVTFNLVPDSTFVFPGDTVRMHVIAADSNGMNAMPLVTWVSTDTAVATVDATGFVQTKSVMRDTAFIIASSGAKADTSRIIVVSPPSTTRLWRGRSSMDWSNANNWSPAGVPTAADTIWIRADLTNQPVLGVNASVGGIVADSGSILDIGSNTLTIGGGLSTFTKIVGTGTVILGGGRLVQGQLPNARMNTNNVTLNGTLVTTGDFLANGGTLNLNGKRLAVGGNFDATTQNYLTMMNGDTLEIAGNATFAGENNTGRLTSGVVIIKGNFVQACPTNVESYRTANAHKTVFAGSGSQTISFGSCNGASYFTHLDLNNGGTVFATDVIVNGNTQVAAGPVTGAGKAYLYGSLESADDEWQVATTHLRSASPSATGRIKSAVIFDMPVDAMFASNISVQGNVTLSAPGRRLNLNGRQLKVEGDFNTTNQTYLEMQNANDVLEVLGNATFQGENLTGRLTNGIVKVTGSFTQACPTNFESYRSTGSHKTLLNGTAAQTVSFGSCGNGSFFNDVEFANGGTVFGTSVIVNGATKVSSGNVTGAVDAYLYGSLEGVDDVWQVATTHLRSSGIVTTGRLKGNVLFDGAGSDMFFGSNVSVLGNVTASAPGRRVHMGGHTLKVEGNFVSTNQTYWEMQNAADTLEVIGNVTFRGENLTGRLTHGLVMLTGNFTQECPSNTESYQSSNSHKTLFNGAGSQTVTFGACGDASYFNDVEFANGGTVFASNIVIGRSVKVTSGPVTGTGEVKLYGSIESGDDVWQIATTRLRAGNITATGRLKTSVIFDGSADMFFGTNLSVLGTVTASAPGRRVHMGGHTLKVEGDFVSTNQTYWEMQNAADTLEVIGNVTFRGENLTGRLTHGLVKLTGNFTQECPSNTQSYQSSNSHKTLFNGAGSQTVTFGACGDASYFNDVEFANAGTVFVSNVVIGRSVKITSGAVTGTGEVKLYGSIESADDMWEVTTTRLRSSSPTATGRLKTNAIFDSGSDSFLGSNITVLGSVTLSMPGRRFVLGARTLKAEGSFSSINQTYLEMQDAAGVLEVTGNATFNGENLTGRLTAGTVKVAGNFTQACSSNIQSYQATGSHKTILNGASGQTVTFGSCSGASYFNDLDLTNNAGVQAGSNFVVGRHLDLVAKLTVPVSTVVDVVGNLRLRSGSTLTNSGTVKYGTFTNDGGTINGNAPIQR